MNGPGKYDDICTLARTEAEAEGVALIVFNGKHGMGFSIQAPLEVMARMPGVLEHMAQQIRNDVATMTLANSGVIN